jgi:hypothetical protein
VLAFGMEEFVEAREGFVSARNGRVRVLEASEEHETLVCPGHPSPLPSWLVPHCTTIPILLAFCLCFQTIILYGGQPMGGSGVLDRDLLLLRREAGL